MFPTNESIECQQIGGCFGRGRGTTAAIERLLADAEREMDALREMARGRLPSAAPRTCLPRR